MPKCDFCGKDATRDTKTVMGPWAYVCENCFGVYGCHVKGLYTMLKQEPKVPMNMGGNNEG